MSDEKRDPPNMDLIQMVQRARMQHDADAKPSDVSAVYWIEAKYEGDDVKPPTPNAGQWMVDIPVDAADTAWEQIKAATVTGQLGYKSKVSTAARSGAKTATRTLIVRVHAASDAAEVQRIKAALDGMTMPGEWRFERDS